MYVDESWQQGRVAEVDRSRAVRNRRIAADTDDPPGLDHHDRIAAHPFARRIEHPRGPQNERSRCVLSRSRDRRSGAQEEEGGGDRARDTVGGFPHDSSPATSGRRAPGSHAVDYTSGETPTPASPDSGFRRSHSSLSLSNGFSGRRTMSKTQIEGSFVATVTPFDRRGEIDFGAWQDRKSTRLNSSH